MSEIKFIENKDFKKFTIVKQISTKQKIVLELNINECLELTKKVENFLIVIGVIDKKIIKID